MIKLILAHAGFSDDSEELKLIRNFRDTYMQNTAAKKSQVTQYYIVSPKIISVINSYKVINRSYILNAMYANYLQPGIKAIRENNLDLAYEYYCMLFRAATQITPALGDTNAGN